MNNWWVGAVIWKEVGGEILVLVQDEKSTRPYFCRQGTKTKFPGGQSRWHPEDITPMDTLRRELREELYLFLPPCRKEPILEVEKSGGHKQIFYLLRRGELKGKLRKENQLEVDTFLTAPRWVPAKLLLTNSGWILPTHYPALVRAIECLVKQKHMVV